MHLIVSQDVSQRISKKVALPQYRRGWDLECGVVDVVVVVGVKKVYFRCGWRGCKKSVFSVWVDLECGVVDVVVMVGV